MAWSSWSADKVKATVILAETLFFLTDLLLISEQLQWRFSFLSNLHILGKERKETVFLHKY